MTFDWQNFLQHYSIPFWDAGKNVARGHLSVKCPWCGSADRSHHMGIELKTGWWGCLRDKSHRGKNPARLMTALAPSLTWAQAIALIDDQESLLAPGTNWESLQKQLKKVVREEKTERATAVDPLPEFRPIANTHLRRRFFNYLVKNRGFRRKDVGKLCAQYDLRCCTSGDWNNRIILPLLKGKKWVGWQGRSISKNPRLRYLSFPGSSAVKSVLFNSNAAAGGGRVLVVVEGPFDALKLDFYGKRFGVRAVGCMTTSVTPEQIAALLLYGRRFDAVVLLLDPTALGQALQMQSDLAMLRPKIITDPPDADDPGAYTRGQVQELCETLCA